MDTWGKWTRELKITEEQWNEADDNSDYIKRSIGQQIYGFRWDEGEDFGKRASPVIIDVN